VTDPRAQLSALHLQSGLSLREFARRVMGRNERSLRDWLGGRPMPADQAAWVARVASVDVTDTTITVRVAR